MNEVEIGRSKRAVTGYAFDDIAIVPTRRTRDPEVVSTGWSIDAFQFEMPVIAAPSDSAMSPETVIALGKMGGLGVLDLEGLWTRYEDPTQQLAEIANAKDEDATSVLQRVYSKPIQAELIESRLKEIRAAGVTVAGALSPHRTAEFADVVLRSGVDMFVIRGNTVSAY